MIITKLLLLWFTCEKIFLNRKQLLLWLAGSVAVQQNFIQVQEGCPPLKFL